jgi:hypothetical protein
MSGDVHAWMRALRRALPLGMVAMSGVLASSASAFTIGGGGGSAGSFVIGDGSAVVGAPVTFWGAQWWKQNSLSSGAAPASFKGFANTVGEPLCGTPWTTNPGNSSGPPEAPLPELIEVIVASEVTKSGPMISGNAPGVALVQTNPGYEPNPGHAGTGAVVARLC